jgi:hypothetical protein
MHLKFQKKVKIRIEQEEREAGLGDSVRMLDKKCWTKIEWKSVQSLLNTISITKWKCKEITKLLLENNIN